MVPITPVTKTCKDGHEWCRTQSTVSFEHPITVHTFQGITLNRAVIYLIANTRNVSLSYLARSRANSLEVLLRYKIPSNLNVNGSGILDNLATKQKNFINEKSQTGKLSKNNFDVCNCDCR